MIQPINLSSNLGANVIFIVVQKLLKREKSHDEPCKPCHPCKFVSTTQR